MTTMTPFTFIGNYTFLNETSKESYRRPFSDEDIITVSILIFSLLVIGVFGNAVTICVIIKNKSLRSTFNIFIGSLCVSDLYSALISPLLLYRRTWGFDEWKITNFLCKFYWGSDMWTSYATALHVLSFAIFRLISIRWPHQFSKITKLHTFIWVITLWLISAASGLVPFLIFVETAKRDRSGSGVTSKWPACTCSLKWLQVCKLHSLIAYPLFFYFPCICIVTVSAIIAGMLLKRRNYHRNSKANRPGNSGHKENQAIVQLALIIGSFLIGYIPFTAYSVYSQLHRTYGNASLRFDWVFGTSYYIATRVSECLNPLFYNAGSTKMRKATYQLFGTCCKRERNLKLTTSFSFGKTSSQESRIPANFDDPIIHDEIAL